MSEKCQMVVFSNKAYNAIIRESFDKDPVETGGILLGHILNNGIWIVMEVLPPGIHSIFERAYFEYDDEFVNYLAQSVANQYKIPLELLGLWHRHPGSMDFFSSTDDQTNFTFASQNPFGVISGLVNIDPVFRLTMYHMDHNPRIASNRPVYETISIEVGDDIIPPEYFELKYFGGEESNLHPQLDRRTRQAKQATVSSASPSNPSDTDKVLSSGIKAENKFEEAVISLLRFFRRKRFLLILLLLLLLGWLVKLSWKQIKDKSNAVIEWVKDKDKKRIEVMEVSVGNQIPLSQYLPKKYSDKSVDWISSDSSIIIKSDTAFCIRPGNYVISFSIDGKKPKQIDLLDVNVTEPLYTINKDKSTLNVGQCDTLSITPSVDKVRWKSNNRQVASVDNDGIVCAKAAGDCIVSCRIDDVTLECQIHVEKGQDTIEKKTDSIEDNGQHTIEI